MHEVPGFRKMYPQMQAMMIPFSKRAATLRQQDVLGNPGKGTHSELCLSLVENCCDLEADFQQLLCYMLFHDGTNIH